MTTKMLKLPPDFGRSGVDFVFPLSVFQELRYNGVNNETAPEEPAAPKDKDAM